MRKSTGDIASREVIRVAMGTQDINNQLETVFQELEGIREVQQTATGIMRNNMVDMHDRMRQLQESATAAKEALNDHIASAAITAQEHQEAYAPKNAQAPQTSGFPEV